MLIRDATPEDWPGIWPIIEPVVRAGETFCWNTDTSEAQARSAWMHQPPGRTFVAVDNGTVVGTAESHPNQAGGGSHVANAGFMVHPEFGGRGIGRALCEHAVAEAARSGYLAMQFNAVVETNKRAVALWRSLGFRVLATVPGAFRHPSAGLVGLHIMYREL